VSLGVLYYPKPSCGRLNVIGVTRLFVPVNEVSPCRVVPRTGRKLDIDLLEDGNARGMRAFDRGVGFGTPSGAEN